MKHKIGLAGIAVGACIALAGCAHSALDRKVDNDVAREEGVKSQSDLRAETSKAIVEAPDLSAEQRSQLLALRDSTRLQSDALAAQSLKLRSVLIKNLMSSNYNEDEMNLIKRRMRKVEDQRLALTFDAVKKANQILGRQAVTHNRVMEDLFDQGHTARD